MPAGMVDFRALAEHIGPYLHRVWVIESCDYYAPIKRPEHCLRRCVRVAAMNDGSRRDLLSGDQPYLYATCS